MHRDKFQISLYGCIEWVQNMNFKEDLHTLLPNLLLGARQGDQESFKAY